MNSYQPFSSRYKEDDLRRALQEALPPGGIIESWLLEECQAENTARSRIEMARFEGRRSAYIEILAVAREEIERKK